MRIVVDGMNVIGSRPDGWWRDRPAARRKLIRDLAVSDQDAEVTVVFDGRPESGEVEEAGSAGIDAVFAPGGPNSADDEIVRIVRAMRGESEAEISVRVVTSDEALVKRVRGPGVTVEGAGAFRARLGG